MTTYSDVSGSRRCIEGEHQRVHMLPKHFGSLFVTFEHLVMQYALVFCVGYRRAYWVYFELSNGCFYMAPAPLDEHIMFRACSYRVEQAISHDAAGIIICLYVLKALSEKTSRADIADKYSQLHDWAMAFHPEAIKIRAALD